MASHTVHSGLTGTCLVSSVGWYLMVPPKAQAKSPLSLDPVKLTNLPSDDEVIKAAEALLDSTLSWKEGKAYGPVRTFIRPKDPAVKGSTSWYCRLSEHERDDVTFDLLWEKLSEQHTEGSKRLTPDIIKVTLIKYLTSKRSVWSIHYNFPSPVSPRVFTVLVIKRLNEYSAHARAGLIVSIPVNITSRNSDHDLSRFEEKGVKGRYVRIEQIKEIDGGKVEWRMAISGTPGGMVPRCLVDRQIPIQIAREVPRFIDWLRSLSKQEEGENRRPKLVHQDSDVWPSMELSRDAVIR